MHVLMRAQSSCTSVQCVETQRGRQALFTRPLFADMSLNASSNASLRPPLLSNSFFYPHFYKCSESVVGSTVFTTFTCVSVLLLLPLSVLVLGVGVRRWRKRRQTSAGKAMSHSDLLTYNAVAMEPIGLLGCGYYCVGIYSEQQRLMKAGVYVVFIVYLGRLLFQCLTCVEHYLAVIHPVTYLSLKTQRGVQLRNATIGCVWLLCLLMMFLVVSFSPFLPTIPFFTFFACGLVVITFCTISVLFALIRPGPGEVGGDRRRVDKSKKRACLNIGAITAVMFLKYAGLLLCTALHASSLLDYKDGCVTLMSAFWFCLPSSLSLPLLFLHREGKLRRLRHKTQSG